MAIFKKQSPVDQSFLSARGKNYWPSLKPLELGKW